MLPVPRRAGVQRQQRPVVVHHRPVGVPEQQHLRAAPLRRFFSYAADPIRFLTAFFTLFIFCGIFNAFNARTHRLHILAHIRRDPLFLSIMTAVSLVQLGLIYYGGALFRTTPLPLYQLCAAAGLALTVIPADLLRKLWLRAAGRERNF